MRIPLTVLEKGDIYFFYWLDEDKKEDNQFFFVLRNQPEGLYRVITLQNGHMPDMKEHHVQKGVMAHTATHLDHLQAYFKRQKKDPSDFLFKIANAMGEGKYLILKWGKSTHLLYSLEDLDHAHQEALSHFGVASQGIFMLQIKNPHYEEAEAKNLFNRLNGQQFIPLDPVELLNEEGIEVLMIGEKSRPSQIGKVNLQTLLDSFSHEDILESVSLEKKQKELELLLTQEWS
ncbi:hypothetical protein RSOCI_03305 [Rhabdochlamydiaceae symbiont of Dictyostelium giganteum]